MATDINTRADQMFPTLEQAEIDRIRRFGTPRSYRKGEAISRIGELTYNFSIILSGKVEITRRDAAGRRDTIVVHRAGSFMGELAQLAGRPSLVDADCLEPVEAIVIPPDRLRALLVAEAELGERIMRAMILRRMGLLETNAGGPIIIGRPAQGDALRLASFLRRNGHPHQLLDIDNEPEAKALIEKFHIDPGELPIVLCPDGSFQRNPNENDLARCLGLVRPIDPERVYDVVVVGAGPAGLATAVYAGSEGLSVLMMDCRLRRSGRRIVPYRELPRLSNRHQRHGTDGACVQSGAEIRRRDRHSKRGDIAAHCGKQNLSTFTVEWRKRQGALRGYCDGCTIPATRSPECR
jgi:thioredoxin reductase (NADPH)